VLPWTDLVLIGCQDKAGCHRRTRRTSRRWRTER